MRLPEAYKEQMTRLLGAEAESYFRSLDEPRLYGLRTNTLKISPEELSGLLPYLHERVKWCPEGFYYPQDERPAKSPYYQAGLFYIQEPSAMSAAALLPVSPGDAVLDLCASPGGKSTQLAAKLSGRGLLAANDINTARIPALTKNIELAGITNAMVLNAAPEALSAKLPGFFNKILVDAPCSGEGMFRKDPDSIKSFDLYKPDECAAMQRHILRHAAILLAPGGMLLYSTCTFEPKENEGMIDSFLRDNPCFEILSLDCARLGLSPGRPEWGAGYPGLSRSARLWPHRLKGEGHFVCLMQKNGDDGQASPEKQTNLSGNGQKTDTRKGSASKSAKRRTAHAQTTVPPDAWACFRAFVEQNICPDIFRADMAYELWGRSLYRLPDHAPDARGLRVSRRGFYLGEVKTGRFEPSQALAMGLAREQAKQSVSFLPDSENLVRYLRGESFDIDAAEGWQLVCVDAYPLGWAKVVDGRLKNKRLKGWL